MEAKPKRRWYQFSLRTLLVFVLVASVSCGWGGARLRIVVARNAAVATVNHLGGEVIYGYQFDSSEQMKFDAQPNLPTWLRQLVGDAGLERVNSVWFMADNGGPTDMTDAGIEALTVLSELKSLVLDHSGAVTDVGVRRISMFTDLEELNLNGTQLTDAGLPSLERLVKLRVLSLNETNVSDSGLKHLLHLKSLVEVRLYGTKVTANGVAQLKRACPNSTIWENSSPDPFVGRGDESNSGP